MLNAGSEMMSLYPESQTSSSPSLFNQTGSLGSPSIETQNPGSFTGNCHYITEYISIYITEIVDTDESIMLISGQEVRKSEARDDISPPCSPSLFSVPNEADYETSTQGKPGIGSSNLDNSVDGIPNSQVGVSTKVYQRLYRISEKLVCTAASQHC